MATTILDQSAQLENFGVSLHRAIINNLIIEVENAIADGRIRSANGRHSVYDFIREVLQKKTEREVWKRFTADFPVVVTFCDEYIFLQKDKAKGFKLTPITDLNGLIYIAYFANCDFSHSLRASSAAYFAADRQNTQPTATVAQLENALVDTPQPEGVGIL